MYSKNNLIIVGFIFILIYFIPFFILKENSFLLIDDNLDGEFLVRILLNKIKIINDENLIEEVFNGLPSNMIQSKLNITVLFFKIFDPFIAYLINEIFSRTIGLVGMFFLINELTKNNSSNLNFENKITLIFSILFSYLGSYNIYYGLTIMGQPILLWIFIKLSKKEFKYYYFIIIFLFTFCSSLIHVGVFLIISLSIWLIIDTIIFKKINSMFSIGIVILIAGYMIVEHELIKSYLFGEVISHREDFLNSHPSFNFLNFIVSALRVLFKTSFHSGVIYLIPLYFMFFLIFLFKLRNKNINILFFTISSILIIKITYSLLLYSQIQIFKLIQFDRFTFLLPPLIISAFCLIFLELFNKIKTIVILLSFGFVTGILYNSLEFRNNLFILFGKKDKSIISYRNYFDKNLFESISKYIGIEKSKYRIASIGISPSISHFNGFYTLDGYFVNYPKDYKKKFRSIISNELGKSDQLRQYFDYWGNRCYIFSSELDLNSYSIFDKKKIELKKLDINTKIFYKLGGRYIFSSIPIRNSKEIFLELDTTFKGAYWEIYLYKVRL